MHEFTHSHPPTPKVSHQFLNSSPYEVRSEELQTAKFKMYSSVAMVTTFPYQQVIQFIVITWHIFTKYEVCTPLNAKVIKVSF